MLELYEFELESYFHMYKVCQLIEAINHFHKFTVATGGLNWVTTKLPFDGKIK